MHDHPVEHVTRRIVRVHMRRVHIARHQSEEFDILMRDRAGQAGRIAKGNIGKNPVPDHLRGKRVCKIGHGGQGSSKRGSVAPPVIPYRRLWHE
jgi:hypothetical protein